MTQERRQEIFAQETLTCKDIMELFGIGKTAATNLMANIKLKHDTLGIQGKVHINDYLQYFGVKPEARYVTCVVIDSDAELTRDDVVRHRFYAEANNEDS